MSVLLEVRDLEVSYAGVPAVRGVNIRIEQGDVLGVVGESGSGKTSLGSAVLGLLPRNASMTGSVHFEGQELTSIGRRRLNRLRGDRISMIMQNPSSCLDPSFTIGSLMGRVFRTHRSLDRHQADELSIEWLTKVGIHRPGDCLRAYPHQLSGGMNQRVAIALALALEPALLIADEPTSALDVTVQAQIIELLQTLMVDQAGSALLITHDLGVVARLANKVAVMYRGRIVEAGPVEQIFASPRDDYTKQLLDSLPSRARGARRRWAAAMTATDPSGARLLLQVSGLRKEFAARDRRRFGHRADAASRGVVAVDDVSLTVAAGETLGIVGESGSGKTTLGRMILGLVTPTSGRIVFDGEDITTPDAARRLRRTRQIQAVFQDPYSALDPRQRIAEIIREPLDIHRVGTDAERRRRVAELMDLVALPASYARSYPHELSGGLRQRVGIATALALGPQLIIADEPVSALDVSVQAQILDLFDTIQAETGVALLFISHDLGVVEQVSDRIAVMCLGSLVETGPAMSILDEPRHPYTEALLSAIPAADPRVRRQRIVLREEAGETPGTGCVFRPRCWLSEDVCATTRPPLFEMGAAHAASCFVRAATAVAGVERTGGSE